LWQDYAPKSYARLGTAWHFWRVSESFRARLAVLAYAIGISNVTGGGRSVHVFDESKGEFPDVYAIVVDHMYERAPGFEPRPGAVVVDVGANVGTFSLRHASYGAHVYAFEPQHGPFQRFLLATTLSGLSSAIDAAPIAIADYEGRVDLDTSSASTTMARLAPTMTQGVTPVARLDALLSRLGHVDIVKIDTEGAEEAVLRGAPDLLARTDRVVLEYHDADKYVRCVELLEASGFIIVEQDAPIEPTSLGLIFAARRP